MNTYIVRSIHWNVAMKSSDYQIRRLKETDRTDVVEIAGLTWQGNDHLPEMFEEWLINPGCFSYAIHVSNKVVSLGNVKLIENSRTAWLEGMRVHPDYRGKGFAYIMTNRMLEVAKEIGASRTRLTLALKNPGPSILARSIGMHPVFSLAVGWKGGLMELELEHGVTNITQVTGTEMPHSIKSNEYILSFNIFVYHWHALDTNEENIAALDEKALLWVLKEDGKTMGLAVGLFRQTARGPEWCTTIYAESENAFRILLRHQILVAQDQKLESIMFQYSEEYETLPEGIIGEKEHGITLILYEGQV